MIKNCKVIINNKAVTVIKYGDIEVQIPPIKRNADFVRVIKKDNNYIVVDDNYTESAKVESVKTKKKPNKKTTVKKSVDETIKEDPVNKDNEDT